MYNLIYLTFSDCARFQNTSYLTQDDLFQTLICNFLRRTAFFFNLHIDYALNLLFSVKSDLWVQQAECVVKFVNEILIMSFPLLCM